MWLRIIICLVFVLSAFSESTGQYVKKGNLPLFVTTEIDYALADWDTAFAVITESDGSLVDTIELSHAEPGRWRGSYALSALLGNYTVEYYAVYSSDTMPGQPYYFSVIDTVSFHGAAAGLTAEELADTLLNRGYIGGAGADTFNLYVFDADTTAIEGVNITIYNKGRTAVVAPLLITDVNGLAITFQDADTFHLYLQRLGVIYTEWDTIVVSNLGIDTIWVVAYDVGSPPSANVTRVKGFTRTYGYQKTDRVTVSFSTHDKNLIDTTAGVFIDKIDEVTYSDTGFFQIDLIPSVSLLSKQAGIMKDSILYDLKIYAPGRSVFEWQNIFIPDTSGAVWLKDLLE